MEWLNLALYIASLVVGGGFMYLYGRYHGIRRGHIDTAALISDLFTWPNRPSLEEYNAEQETLYQWLKGDAQPGSKEWCRKTLREYQETLQ